MKLSIIGLFCGISILYVIPVRGQTYVSSTVWVVPDGNTADFSRTYTEGITLQVTWNSVLEGYQFSTLSNLCVTTWDYEVIQFSQLLTKNVNTNSSGTYDWTITIPANVLSTNAKYVLRLKDLSSMYNASSQEVSSTGFLIINGGSSSPASSIAKTSSTQTVSSASSTSFTSTVTAPPITSTAATSTSIPKFKGSDLSRGAKAGIAVGIFSAALLIAGSAYLFFRRRCRTKTPSHETPLYPPTDPSTPYEPPKQISTVYTSDIAEIGGHERAELPGS
ncbi:hypothetical protein EYC80_001110 [Monilinia laxa]|uniref:Mid2 domain-containing protein n=1 Tax=Monilinia laxa TaxID=61186 RepID=A0A5N6K8B5_MONLA|nr:hypothetical protein EYC80_001110 [Monilinia laxa]